MGLAASRQEAFWEACGFGHVQRVKKFLKEDIDVNWKSYTHDCCAIHVASQGKPEIVDLLLEAGCDVNVKDDRGNLALHHAAMKGHADIMKTLIKAGSEINAQDKNGWTSLHCAAYWAHPKAVRVLIESGIDIHLQNKDQRTALHETARSKEELDVELGEITRELIKAGCDINAKSSDEGEADFTPLMFAAYHGHPEVASALIDAGCELNSRGTNLWTALHWAADRQNEEVVYILLEAGADPTCKGMRGELAADRSPSNPDLREMLLNAVNMFSELSSLGGVNSQATSPVIETCAGVPKLSTPLADSEDTELIEREAPSENTVSEESNPDSEKSSDVTENINTSPVKNDKDEMKDLGNALEQRLDLTDNSEENVLSQQNDSVDEVKRGDNSDILESSSADPTDVSCVAVQVDSCEGTTRKSTDTDLVSADKTENAAQATSNARTPSNCEIAKPKEEGSTLEPQISG